MTLPLARLLAPWRLLLFILATEVSGQLRRQRRRRGGWRPRAGQLNVVIFGPPGVGKGTQSARIQQAFGLCHVSTGDILRREIARKSKPGLEAQSYVSRGAMVPDELIIRLVKRRLANDEQCQQNGWLLDGFPRTAAQANAMVLAGLTPHHILVLDAADATVKDRVLGRAREARRSGHTVRSDDNEATVQNRLREYHKNRDAVLSEFDRFLRLSTVNGEPAVGNVTSAIRAALSQ